MKAFAATLALVCFVGSSFAEKEAKEVELKGLICCSKCELKQTKACATVIKVKDKDDKEVIYVFDAASNKKHHKGICTEAKEGTVKGTVKKDGDKMIITVSELKFKE